MSASSARPWWQFRLRSVLLGAIPLSLVCAWMGYHLNAWRSEQEALKNLAKLGNLQYSDAKWKLAEPFARVSLLGVTGVMSEESLNSIVRLRHMTALHAANTRWTDGALKQVSKLTKLRLLDASHSDISDFYVDELARVPALAEIHLQGSEVTEAGVARLRELRPDLEILDD